MRKNKDVNSVIARLRALSEGGGVGPEQKKPIETALEHLKWLRRKSTFTQNDVSFCVRKVAEELLNAFFRK
jgi:hypothetical protein